MPSFDVDIKIFPHLAEFLPKRSQTKILLFYLPLEVILRTGMFNQFSRFEKLNVRSGKIPG